MIRKFVPGGSSGSKPAITPGGVVTPASSANFRPSHRGHGSRFTDRIWPARQPIGATHFKDINAPTTLGGTTVTIGGLNTYIEYVSPGQVNVQAPFALNPGSQTMVVSTAAGQSAAVRSRRNTAPGLYAPSNFRDRRETICWRAASGWYLGDAGGRGGRVYIESGQGGRDYYPLRSRFRRGEYGQQTGQKVQALNSLTTALTIFFGPSQATITYHGLAPRDLGCTSST